MLRASSALNSPLLRKIQTDQKRKDPEEKNTTKKENIGQKNTSKASVFLIEANLCLTLKFQRLYLYHDIL